MADPRSSPSRRVAIALGAAAILGTLALLATMPRRRAPGAVAHVLVVSLDGVSSAAIKTLGATGTPVLHALAAEGAYTWNARTEPRATETLPNHTSMLSGRDVDTHGVRDNMADAISPEVSSIFEVVAASGGTAALIASKAKFALLADRWAKALRTIDVVERSDQDTVEALARVLDRGAPTLVFLHLAGPDRAGHASGWGSTPYLEGVRAVDAQLGAAVAMFRHLEGPLAIIVTSDHGGHGQAHDDADDPANFTIPLVVVAPGAHGELYVSNAGRRVDPGTLKSSLAGPPIRNTEVANLAARLLGLGFVPGATAAVDIR